MSNYWDETLRRRLTRRRALAVGGSAAAGAFILACGGSGGDEPASPAPPAEEEEEGLVTRPVDTSNQAVQGGTLQHFRNADTDNMDPYASNSNITSSISGLAYSRLTMLEAGYMEESAGNVTGDIAEGWEWSADHLQLIMHLKPGVRFHNIPPVNGREMDMEDVLLSWERFADRGLLRSELVNEVSPAAPVLRLEATDDRTVVFHLAQPLAYLPTLLATPNSGNPHIAPKEADQGFEMRQMMIGSGPFMLDRYEPSIGWRFRRNPDYFLDPSRPYVDELNLPIIQEYAAGLAQFEAGNLHYFAVLPQDILEVTSRRPDIALYQTYYQATGFRSIFGWNPTPADRTPFRDERVRQAYVLTWDRQLFTDVVYNVERYEDAGWPIETRWNTAIQANWYSGWWLDPQGPDFGPNARYFQKNVEEAKKLMVAAGFPDGVEVLNTYWTTGQGGPDFPQNVEVLCDMAREVGFSFVPNVLPFTGDYAPLYRDSKGQFEGISYKFGPSGGGQDAIGQLNFFYHSQGGGFGGFDPNGVGDFSGDPWVDEQLDKAKVTFDDDDRRAIAHELQRHLARTNYIPRWPAAATGFELAWKALRNYRVWDRDPRPNFHFWLDQTQPPFT